MSTAVLTAMTDNSAKDNTGDAINGSEVDANPNVLAKIMDGTTDIDMGGDGVPDFLQVRIIDLDNATGAVQRNHTTEWDPADGGQMTDNSSGVGHVFKMPSSTDVQREFAALDIMCVDDTNASEIGEFSFKTMVAGTLSEVMTLQSALTTTGTVLNLSTLETTVVDGDVLGRIDFQAPSEASGTDSILVGASIYAEADDTFSTSLNDTDLVFAVAESETAAERMRLSYDGTTTDLNFGSVMTLTSGGDITLAATGDVNLAANIGLTFGDDGEKIEGNGTDLTISASNDLNLTASTDINVPVNVGMTFGDDGEKIEGDGTDMTIASSGNLNLTATAVLASTQPAFLAYSGVSQTNVAGNTSTPVTVEFDTEVFDQGTDFASHTFTAPVTGRYHLSCNVFVSGITTACTQIQITMVASNRTWGLHRISDPSLDHTQVFAGGSALVDMDAADTVVIQYLGSGEASDVHDLPGGSTLNTSFSGFLAC